MKKITLVLSTLFSSFLFAQNHTFSWMHTFGSNVSDEQINSIGSNGSHIVTGGAFYGSNTNLGNGNAISANSQGSSDFFVNNYNAANGNTLLSFTAGGSLLDYAKDVEVDANGNFYVYGVYQQQIELDTNLGGASILIGAGITNGFLAKYNPSGGLLWSINIDGDGTHFPGALKLDAAGNSYVAFSFSNDIFPNPTNLALSYISAGGSDICVAKYDITGNFVWAKHIGGTADDMIEDVYIHNNGNISSVGYFNATVDFDPNAGVQNYTATNGSAGFLWRLDNLGNFLSTNILEGTSAGSNVIARTLDIDINDNFYIAGSFNNDMNLNPSGGSNLATSSTPSAGFMISIDASRNYRWGKTINFNATNDKIACLKTAGTRFYITGNFGQTVDMDPSAATANLITNNTDVFLAAYDINGNYIWAKQTHSSNQALANDLLVDANGAIYVAGQFNGTTNFNFNAGNNSATSNNNTANAFIVKLSECTQVTNGTDLVNSCGSFTWIDGNTYTSSNNTATFTLQGVNQFGCDSIVTLNLTMGSTVNKTDIIQSCGPITWLDGNTYSSNNSTATFTIVGANPGDCDTTITLNLTIGSANTGIDVVHACDSFIWINGTTYYASTNTPTFLIPNGNQSGCDSTVTLNLTMHQAQYGIDTKTSCGSYEWIDGNVYSNSTTAPQHTILGGAANGCDSIVTLHLTVNVAPSSTFTHSACGSYTWIDNNNYTSSNNTASYTYINQGANGCDSTVFLDLTINTIYSLTETVHACSSYTWINGITYTSSNSTATFSTLTASGCDSTVTLNLTIPIINKTVSLSAQTFTLTSLENDADSYQWFDCVNQVPVLNETNQSFTPTQNGKYSLKITKGGCTETSDCITIAGIGIAENSLIQSIFPNPTKNLATVTLAQNVEKGNIQILDLSGKILHVATIENTNSFTISLEDYPSGMYIIKVNSGNSVHFQKLVKE